MSRELDFEKLRILAYKLRCLGYLVETQDPNHVCPVDFDEAQYCPVRAPPAQIGSEFKSTKYLKVTTPVPNAFFSAVQLSV